MIGAYQILLLFSFLAFSWAAQRDLRYGVYAVIFLMPAYLWRFSLRGIPATALEILIYLLFGTWLARSGKVRETLRDIARDKVLAFGIALLLAGVVLSTLNSTDMRTSLGVFKGWFVDPLLFFLMYISVIRTPDEVRATLRAYTASACAVALVAAIYALSGHFTFDGRLRAFYESPNHLAMYLAPALLITAYCLCRNGRESYPVLSQSVGAQYLAPFRGGNPGLSRIKEVYGLGLLFFFLILFLTHSSGAMLSVLLALLWLLGKKFPRDARRKNILQLGALLLVLIFLSLGYAKYQQVVNSHDRSSLHSRLMIWQASVAMLKDSPWVGIGPGTFQETYLAYQPRFATPYLEWAVPQPHNTLLAFYLQTGLLGLLGFLLLLSWLARRSRQDLVSLLLIYFLLHGLVDTLYWKNDLALIFWFVLAAAYVGKKKTTSAC